MHAYIHTHLRLQAHIHCAHPSTYIHTYIHTVVAAACKAFQYMRAYIYTYIHTVIAAANAELAKKALNILGSDT